MPGRAAFKQATDLCDGKFQPHFLDCFGASAFMGFFKFQIEFSGNVCAAHGKRAPYGRKALNGKHSGYDRLFYAHTPQTGHQFEIFASVEKELRNDEIRSGFDFPAQIFPVMVEGRGTPDEARGNLPRRCRTRFPGHG